VWRNGHDALNRLNASTRSCPIDSEAVLGDKHRYSGIRCVGGHVFCSFLALVLKKALEDRIAALARSGSWPQIIADLDSLTETEIEHDGKRFLVRSAPRPAASLALPAAGVALPPTVREAAAR
jgi:hypothetical protein